MKKIIVFLIFNILKIFSLLPISVLYFFGKIITWYLKNIFEYRKSVIELNLMNSFYDKKSVELWHIRNEYYTHLGKLFAENIKSISISKNELQDRVSLHHNSLQLFKNYEKRNQNIILLQGHYNNWEWSVLLGSIVSKLPYNILFLGDNTIGNLLLNKIRTRFGAEMFATNYLEKLKQKCTQQSCVTAFAADQTPVKIDKAYWCKFLSQNTPFHNGFEKFAKNTNAIVLYVNMKQVANGYYEIILEPITENAQNEPENFIVESYIKKLEKNIIEQPQYWLWSHKRWKRAGVNY